MKHSKPSLIVPVAFLSFLVAGSARSQVFNPANGHNYVLSPSMSFQQARTYAQSLGGYLVAINDAAEQAFIASHFSGNPWIGFSDEIQEGVWVWDSGEPTSYLNWCGGEPNNAGNEDYGQLAGGSCWNDATGSGSLPGIVEIGLLSATTLAPIGTPLVYSIHTLPSSPYVFDVSVTGTTPGVTVGGTQVPLNPPFLNLDTAPAYSSYFSNFVGFTNAAGNATPIVTVPLLPQLVGTSLYGCCVMLDPGAPNGIGAISDPTTTVFANPLPHVNGVMPATSPSTGNWPITISGSHFQTGATVLIGGAAATNVVVSASSITCDTPPHALGAVSIVVQNPDGFSATLANGLTYVVPIVLTSVAPLAAAAGATVTITGSGIQAGSTVSVGGVPATVLITTPTSIAFTRPPGIPCNTTVVVTEPDAQTASLPYNPGPSITNVFNPSGPTSGGSIFIILGANFLPGTTVTIGGAPATITSQSTTVLFLVTPPGSPGPATVVISSVAGCITTTTFLYQ